MASEAIPVSTLRSSNRCFHASRGLGVALGAGGLPLPAASAAFLTYTTSPSSRWKTDSTGTASTLTALSPLIETLAVMPVRSSLPWESRETSTSNTLTWSARRAAGAMRDTLAGKRTFGYASSVTVTGAPRRTLPMSTSLTPALTSIVERSATVAITVPALNDPAPVTASPSSTGRVITTPSIGAVMLMRWSAVVVTGTPDDAMIADFSRAASSSSRVVL